MGKCSGRCQVNGQLKALPVYIGFVFKLTFWDLKLLAIALLLGHPRTRRARRVTRLSHEKRVCSERLGWCRHFRQKLISTVSDPWAFGALLWVWACSSSYHLGARGPERLASSRSLSGWEFIPPWMLPEVGRDVVLRIHNRLTEGLAHS